MVAPSESEERSTTRRQCPRGPRRCVYATFRLPLDVVEELRDFVVFQTRMGGTPTMAAVVECGLRSQLEQLKAQFNEGHPFPKRDGDVGAAREGDRGKR